LKTSIFLSVIVLSLVFVGVSTSFGQEDISSVICDWDDGKISDSQFLSGIEEAIESEDFLFFEFVQSDKYDPRRPIPDSVRTTASLWCQGKAGGVDLENAMRLLFDEELLKVDIYNVLKVEKKIYDRPYSLTTTNVKLFGQLDDKFLVDKITFRLTDPKGNTDELSVAPTKDGYFENYLIMDKKSALGTYMVSAYEGSETMVPKAYLGSVKFDLLAKEQSQKEDGSEEPTPRIPDWVKNTMGWYAEGLISEDDIILAIKFLIQEGIIKLD